MRQNQMQEILGGKIKDLANFSV